MYRILHRRKYNMSEKDKQHTGEVYFPGDPEILEEQIQYQEKLYDYNQTRPSEQEKRTNLLKEMFAEIGENCYANYNLTAVDDTHIYVGDNTMIAPNVILASAAHPLDPEERRKGYQYNQPVHIGKNCWLGAGVIVVPGVSIGDDTVIGAGSVVTKDIPSGVVAVGNPCRVIKEIKREETNG